MFFSTSSIENATSSVASDDITKRDAAIGVEQRVSQPFNDSNARDSRIDTNKKVEMKKKAGRLYGKIESQMVSDPPGKIIDSTNCSAVMQYQLST